MEHLHTSLLERRQMGRRVLPGGFDNLDAGLDNGLAIFFVRRRLQSRKNCEVHTKRLIGHFLAARDLFGQIFRGWLGQSGEKPERPGIGHRCHHFCGSNPLHAALHDWMLDTELFCKTCFEHGSLLP